MCMVIIAHKITHFMDTMVMLSASNQILHADTCLYMPKRMVLFQCIRGNMSCVAKPEGCYFVNFPPKCLSLHLN